MEEQLARAEGYLTLRMFDDAWEELDSISPGNQNDPKVLIVRLAVLQSMERWEQGADLAREMVKDYPDHGDLYIMGAYCIRRYADVSAARDFLVQGEECLSETAIYWFNLGCYECLIGDTEAAREHVEKACKMDGGFKSLALKDTDLKPLWRVFAEELD